ncbi:hypothetical protein MXM41_12435 [Leclercia adecarboxylata]|uniref:hypothetical protein n=1 Tax=Leclercia adecarboxylata TaxID=83655 RepID=UPI002DBAC969|nr:hypothetical protein [Leclercia adecarboxylata]MEB6379732.1 hypothetical protein [Leclercia adecarboxylata]
MSTLKNYAESVLFQSVISLAGRPCTPDSLAALSENYISRLGKNDLPVTLRKTLTDIQLLLTLLSDKNKSPPFTHEAWMNKNLTLLTLITELYTEVVAWNAVEQYLSASEFLLFSQEKTASQSTLHKVIN